MHRPQSIVKRIWRTMGLPGDGKPNTEYKYSVLKFE
jgi:hypothetical protein